MSEKWKEGDEIKDGTASRLVLADVGLAVCVSQRDDHGRVGTLYTQAELEKQGYRKIKPKTLAEQYPCDTLVMAECGGMWLPLYSAGEVDEDGWLYCYDDGRTSKTITDSDAVTGWRVVKPYEEATA